MALSLAVLASFDVCCVLRAVCVFRYFSRLISIIEKTMRHFSLKFIYILSIVRVYDDSTNTCICGCYVLVVGCLHIASIRAHIVTWGTHVWSDEKIAISTHIVSNNNTQYSDFVLVINHSICLIIISYTSSVYSVRFGEHAPSNFTWYTHIGSFVIFVILCINCYIANSNDQKATRTIKIKQKKYIYKYKSIVFCSIHYS